MDDRKFTIQHTRYKMEQELANTENNYQLINAINQVAYQANPPENRDINLLQAVASDTINESTFLLNPIAKGYARLAAYGSYFWFLGFNVSSAVVNFTQVPLVVQPFLAGEYGGGPLGQQKAAEALGRASKLYFSGPGKKVGLQFEQTEGFLPDSTAAPFKVDVKTGDKTFIGPNAQLFALKGQRYQIKETDKVKIAEKDGKSVLEALSDEQIEIVSLTITEKGYHYNSDKKELDFSKQNITFNEQKREHFRKKNKNGHVYFVSSLGIWKVKKHGFSR